MSDKSKVKDGKKTHESLQLTRKELEKVVGGAGATQTGKTDDNQKKSGPITLPEI